MYEYVLANSAEKQKVKLHEPINSSWCLYLLFIRGGITLLIVRRLYFSDDNDDDDQRGTR